MRYTTAPGLEVGRRPTLTHLAFATTREEGTRTPLVWCVGGDVCSLAEGDLPPGDWGMHICSLRQRWEAGRSLSWLSLCLGGTTRLTFRAAKSYAPSSLRPPPPAPNVCSFQYTQAGIRLLGKSVPSADPGRTRTRDVAPPPPTTHGLSWHNCLHFSLWKCISFPAVLSDLKTPGGLCGSILFPLRGSVLSHGFIRRRF